MATRIAFWRWDERPKRHEMRAPGGGPERSEARLVSNPQGSIPSGERLTRAHLVLIGVCAVGYFMDGLSSAILGPFAPAVARTLQLSRAELGPIFSASLLGQCVGLIVIPLFQGRLGPRRTIVCSTILFGLGDLASGFAASRDQLILCRLAIGVGVGGALPAAISLVSELVPPGRRGTSLMALILAFTMGPAVAGLIGSVVPVTSDSAWRWTLLAVGGISLAAAGVQGRWLPDAPSFLDRHSGETAVRERTAREGAPLRLFAPGMLAGTLLLWSMFINATIISYCLTSWLPTLLIDSGRSARLGSMALTAFAVGGMISTVAVGYLIDRVGKFRTLGVSFAACASFLVASALGIRDASDGLLLALLAAVGFFLSGAFGGVNVLLADFYPAPLRAVGAGWAKSAGRIGSVIAPIAVGWALTWGVPEPTILLAFAVPALLIVLAIAGMYLSGRRRAVTVLP